MSSSWRDRMGPAEFRGVSFFIDSAERTGGRRTVKHEYPFKAEPFIEDLGRKARSFPVEGYVIGVDYMTQRNALLQALEQPGPGELIHPYHGPRRVMVGEYRVRESRDNGGMAVFSIEFLETPAQPVQPTAVVDDVSVVQTSSAVAIASIGATFLASYNPGVLLSSVKDELRAATLAVDNVLSAASLTTQTLAALKSQSAIFAASIEAVVNTPSNLLASITALIGALPIRSAAESIYSFDPGIRPPSTTVNRIQEQANFDATRLLIQRLAAIQTAILVVSESFGSFDDAVVAQIQVTNLLDLQMEASADDAFPALLQLRTDVVKAVPGANSTLAHLIKLTPVVAIPSLVLAYRLYGDLSLENDLIARNHVQNPGFVVGGRELEVLSSG